MLQEELCRILDLPAPLVYNERKKLEGTYMVLSTPNHKERIVYIRNISPEGISVAYTDGHDGSVCPADKVEKLDIFLPDTDIYHLPEYGCYASIFKRAQRQWKKSLCHDIYSITIRPIDGQHGYEGLDGFSLEILNSVYITEPQPKSFWVYNGTLMLFDKPVAKVKGHGEVEVINPIFKQEINEYFDDTKRGKI